MPGGHASARGERVDDLTDEHDESLIRRVVQGDQRAYGCLLHRHQDRIYRVALRVLDDSSDAEDAAQEVMLRLPTALHTFAGTSSFPTWLHRVVVNHCLGQLRRRRRAPLPLTADEPGPAPGADAVTLSRQRSAAVLAAVGGLEPLLRAVLVLCDFEGLTYHEIAVVLQVPVSTVRGRLFRARRALLPVLRQWA